MVSSVLEERLALGPLLVAWVFHQPLLSQQEVQAVEVVPLAGTRLQGQRVVQEAHTEAVVAEEVQPLMLARALVEPVAQELLT